MLLGMFVEMLFIAVLSKFYKTKMLLRGSSCCSCDPRSPPSTNIHNQPITAPIYTTAIRFFLWKLCALFSYSRETEIKNIKHLLFSLTFCILLFYVFFSQFPSTVSLKFVHFIQVFTRFVLLL